MRVLVALAGFVAVLPFTSLNAQNRQSASLGSVPNGATSGATVASAARAASAPTIDGVPGDPVWETAPLIDQFLEYEPNEGAETRFRTEARLLYDDRNLYVLVRMFDPAPDSIVSQLARRDVRVYSEHVKLVIDSYHDRRTAYQFALSPAGVKRDFYVYNDQNEDPSWDAVWDGEASVDSLGWTAEFRIPLSQLRFANKAEHTWGLMIVRDVARTGQRISWPLFRRAVQGYVSQSGVITGIRNLPSPRRLEVSPYVVTKNVTVPEANGFAHEQEVTGGADIKYGLASNLTLDATINPDFGQVEADPAVLNLTAFEVRFEERRPFFQEGVGMFRCQPCQGIFYPRRIGRTPQLRSNPGDPLFTTILGAAKFTGRFAGGLTLGVIDAVTQREVGVTGRTVEPQTNYLVARAARDFRDGRTQIGLITTAVNRSLDADTRDYLRRDAHMAVLEGFHRFAADQYEFGAYTGRSIVLGSEAAIARTQLSSVHLHQRPDGDERFDSTRTSMSGGVVAFSLAKISGAVRFSSFVRLASTEIELNDAGLVPLINDKSIRNSVSLRSLRPGSWYRASFSMLETENHWTSGGMPSGNLARVHTSFSMKNNWGWALTYTLNNPSTNYCIACARGGPALRMEPFQTFQVNVNGDNRRAIIPQFEWAVAAGDGNRSWERRGSVGADLRLSTRFSTTLSVGGSKRVDNQQWIANYGHFLSDTTHYTFARLAQTTLSMTARASFTATPLLTFQFYAQPFMSAGSFADWREINSARASQYDNRFAPYGNGTTPNGFNFKQFNSNAVIRWEYRPGSTLFLVWQQGRVQDSLNRGSFELERDYRDLFRAHPVNTFLVKATYFFNP